MLVLFVFSATITDNFVFNKISSCDLAELWNSASRNLSLRDSILVIRSTSTWLGGKLFGKSKMKVQITIKLAIYFLMLRKLQPSNNKLITGLFKSTGFLLTWFAQPVITNPVVHVASIQLLDLDLTLYPSYMPHILNKDLTPFLQSLSGKQKIEQVKERLYYQDASMWQTPNLSRHFWPVNKHFEPLSFVRVNQGIVGCVRFVKFVYQTLELCHLKESW